MKTASPGQLIWKRFRKNKVAVAGLFLIALALFVAIFCNLILPDHTPGTNRMCLPINNRMPGFEVKMILARKNFPVEPAGWWSSLWNGEKDQDEFIPVDSAWVEGADVHYQPYTSGSMVLQEEIVPLADVVWSVKDIQGIKLSANTISAIDINGQLQKSTINELTTQFYQSHYVKRKFWLGTDRYGRDLLSRLLAGTRVTFVVGLVAVIISLLVGVFLGGLAGYFRGGVDRFILWLINVVWSVPTLLLVIAITLVLGKGFMQVFIAVGLTMWVDVARIVRSQLFAVRELDFVAAGTTMGFKGSRVLLRHMLPNVIGPVLVVAAANFSTAILLEAGLSFLGIGAQPPTPSWGCMIKENYGFIILPDASFLAILPGVAILLLTLAFTFVANGLRDAMDTKTQLLSGS